MRILLVEDEQKVASFIKQGLQEHLHDVSIAYDGQIGFKLASSQAFDLMILDVNLPIVNGYELCKQIRQKNTKVPILMLTALGATDDKVTGFESGADDYLVKPFEFAELIARVKALHKRSNPANESGNILKVDDLELDQEKKIVKRGGQKIDLTAKEFGLLEYLLKHQGKVISRAEIADKVWDIHFDTGTNIIDVYINFLRKKIEKEFGKKLIHTVVGMGYTIRDEN